MAALLAPSSRTRDAEAVTKRAQMIGRQPPAAGLPRIPTQRHWRGGFGADATTADPDVRPLASVPAPEYRRDAARDVPLEGDRALPPCLGVDGTPVWKRLQEAGEWPVIDCAVARRGPRRQRLPGTCH